ncbi:MAG: YqgE/AlgH family protein [Fibrobacteria bacterium]|nr:YqgE/AlgH family protein [Fibrobacteria bacterium]
MADFPEQLGAGSHIGELGAGSFLFSTNALTDPNFMSTVILICQHSEDGSYGLVLNRPAHMPLSEIFNSVDKYKNQIRRVHIGGPVQGSELQILQVSGEPAKGALEVVEGVYLGGYWDDLDKIIESDTRQIRLFLGYSGWGEGQLAEEIKMGGWEVYNADVKRVFTEEEDPWMQGLDAFKKKYFN